MSATRKDVARLAGVSETTVSFVLSGKRYVSKERADRVRAAVKQLNYHPDMIAKTMKGKKTHSIAVLINDFTNPLYMQIIESIENKAMDNGYFVNICGGNTHLERYIDEFISRRVDGVFIVANSDLLTTNHIEQLLENNISVVYGTVNDMMDDKICGVAIDFNKGMNDIVSYLKENGHGKIAYMSLYNKGTNDLRLDCFKNSMKKYFGIDNPIIEYGCGIEGTAIKTGYDGAEKLLSRNKDVTAIICMNDLLAVGAISAIDKNGYRVPDDISVVGIDNISISAEYAKGITTLSHKAEYFGEKVFDVLKRNVVDKNDVGREIIAPELIIRSTTKKI